MQSFSSLFLASLLAGAALAGCGGSKASDAAKTQEPAPATEAAKTPAPLPGDVSDLASVSDPSGAVAGSPATSDAAAPSAEAQPGAAAATVDGATVAATGEFVSPVRSEVAAKFQGRVGRVMADEGQRVRRGQPLFQLETEYLVLDVRRADADLARAKASAQEAERDFARKKDLIAKGSIAQAAYDRSQGAYESAEAAVAGADTALDLARQRLADAVIRSPIDGVVDERKANVGEKLGDNSVAFVVVQTSPLKLRFRLPERYLGAARAGQRVRANVDPYPGESFDGRVALVGGVVDPATRTVMVETEFPNRDGRLSPGLFARVEIDLAGKSAKGAAK
jgi:RND family efflux transporter MFP subunit